MNEAKEFNEAVEEKTDGVKEVLDSIDDNNADSDLEYEFPAGYYDKENGKLIKDFEIREMTGADEEALAGVAKKNKGAKIINKALERCLVRIGNMTEKSVGGIDAWRKIIQSLCVPDQDFAIAQIQKVSVEDEIESSHVCPECGQKIKTFFKLDELEVEPYRGETEQVELFELPRGYKDKKGVLHKSGVIRLPNGLDREIVLPVAKTNLSKGTTLMLTRLCTFDDGYPMTESVLREISLKDRRYLENLNKEMLSFGIDLSVDVECNNCGSVFKGSINSLSFQ